MGSQEPYRRRIWLRYAQNKYCPYSLKKQEKSLWKGKIISGRLKKTYMRKIARGGIANAEGTQGTKGGLGVGQGPPGVVVGGQEYIQLFIYMVFLVVIIDILLPLQICKCT